MFQFIASNNDGFAHKYDLRGSEQMTRNTLIWKIVNALNDNETLDIRNFETYVEQAHAIHDIIQEELEGYVIVEGKEVQ